ncbi:MAG: class I SAM-dependent methyltransferase, partial [Bdellovibrionota bacterium]
MGSGVGKLCLILSLVSDLQVTGVEQRSYLVEIAKMIAKRNSLAVRFDHMNCLDVDWGSFDVFFFYNPFQEHIALSEFHLIDDQVDLDRKFHVEYTERVRHELSKMSPGRRLITFHGYGGRIPGSFKLIRSARVGNGKLCMWEKMSFACLQNKAELEGGGELIAANDHAPD